MGVEVITEVEQRAALHAALADPGRLRIIDLLRLSDATPSELAIALDMAPNLLAHHLKLLGSRGLVVRTRSEGDRRRSYVHLVGERLCDLLPPRRRHARRVLFVCTANTARSHLAAALWRKASSVPAASAGTHPAGRIDPRALASAARHDLPMQRAAPQSVDDVRADGDLVVTVCDLAHEELGTRADLHWSVPDPVRIGRDSAFDAALEAIANRIGGLCSAVTADE